MKWKSQRVRVETLEQVRSKVGLPTFEENLEALLVTWGEAPPQAQAVAKDEALRLYGGMRIASRMKRYEVAGKTAPKA